jgi:hypothetical protein
MSVLRETKKPEVTFINNGGAAIVIKTEYGWPIAELPYDSRLTTLSAYGGELDWWWLFWGTPPEQTRHRLEKCGLKAPIHPIANWKKRGHSLVAVDLHGKTIKIQDWRSREYCVEIWRGSARLCFGGYIANFDDKKTGLAVANNFALGRPVPGFHWDDEPAAITATTIRVWAEVSAYNMRRRGVRMDEELVWRVRIAFKDATCAMVFWLSKHGTKDDTLRAMDNLRKVHSDICNGGVDFDLYVADARSWILPILIENQVPFEHADFFVEAPLHWLERMKNFVEFGSERLGECNERDASSFNPRAVAALNWLFDAEILHENSLANEAR